MRIRWKACAAGVMAAGILCETPGALIAARFSPEVEAVLAQKREELTQGLLEDPGILEAVRASNARNQTMAMSEVLRLDGQWKAAKATTAFMEAFTTNACAKRLIAFQQSHQGYSEIFIADARGLIVGETNITSDYYQADEDWWINAYADGRGQFLSGDIEYDESARSEAISLYLPVTDPETKQAIGVMKAVIDLMAIKAGL